jgi:amidohydrolase
VHLFNIFASLLWYMIKMNSMRYILLLLLFGFSFNIFCQRLNEEAMRKAGAIENQVVEWRRYFHENPELSNREFNTSKKIAAHLRSLGLEVQEGIAKTGVVGVLKGGKDGPVVALRADIDALPVTERSFLPFKSEAVTIYNGQEIGVMHACGHDSHIAILMGVASVLSEMQAELKGTVKFIFQPAEEGPPPGEEGGARLMVKEGVLESPNVDAIFGLHITGGTPIGQISYKSGGFMASSDRFEIVVKGKQAHGSTPWASIDPIAISTQIINSLQYIISRNAELTNEAAVITVGMIQAGVRYNIIPEEARFVGTIRTLDIGMQEMIHEKIRSTAMHIAAISGATATVEIINNAPLTYNDPALTAKMLTSLDKSTAPGQVVAIKAVTTAEDFSYFQQKVPGLYFFIGGKPANEPYIQPFNGHHTPDFKMDESGMITGVKAFLNLTIDYMEQNN